ncbi:MAG TPA: DEAD/DEAH box helicase [Massilibacterium sp.]|nr:DEAD/DEAH box helicase [Massilibacterium sp.]
MDYEKFLDKKRHLTGKFGFEPLHIPNYLFEFQQYIVDWALKKGRAGIFADTGLGKTIMELVIAENIIKKTNGRVLILTPLAVAFQFIEEAKQFGIGDVDYSRDGSLDSKIVITNYERLEKFDSNDFDAVLLDESSILKNFDGAIRKKVNAFMKKIKYRFLFTATPSPNDFVELGTSAEALGYMGYMDMLSKFFTNNEDSISPQNIGTQWRLKGHAKDAFFEWVGSWSISVRKPKDLGFEDDRFELPDLNIEYHPVKNEENMIIDGQILLFNRVAQRLSEVREENRLTIGKRCEKAVELANQHDCSVYWCNLNKESNWLNDLDNDARQITGSMSIDQKEELLLAFSHGKLKKLITKPTITAFGLNWQHCNHTIYFPTFSYEQYYQAVRRFWRFGQTDDVLVDMVYSDGQKRVIDSLLAKADKADRLFEKLNNTLNSSFKRNKKQFNKQLTKPSFL